MDNSFRLNWGLPILVIVFVTGCTSLDESSDYVIWFDEPAQHFEQSFVMGNGRAGASVFGGVNSETIILNEATLWTGEPVDPHMNPDAHKYLPLVREALLNEDYPAADSLNRFIQGSFSESFAPLGNLHLEFKHGHDYSYYERMLHLNDALSQVRYDVGDVKFEREYFVSYPDKVFAVQLNSNQDSSLNFDLSFSSLLKYQPSKAGNTLTVSGYAPYHAEPSYRGDMPDAVQFDKERGMRFTVMIRVIDSDGEIAESDTSLNVSHASRASILVSMATSFNGFDKDPAKEGIDDLQLAQQQLSEAAGKTFDQIRSAHIQDFSHYFDRVDISLGEADIPELPIDKRLKRYAEGGEDKELEEMYFQFGRYLLISSSRTPQVPANLQGIWNHYMRPPWSSNYTMNINVQENYWMAESGNLSDMHSPLLDFINNLAVTGAITAKTFYGIDKGWTACHNSDIWAMSNPVGDFGKGHPVWANWNMSGAWLSTHLWDHFLYTGDTVFLRQQGYPLMKGAAEFCLEWLSEDGNGHLVSSPSTSPENLYVTPEGYAGATLYGSTADHAMIRQLFLQTIRASELLDMDHNLKDQLKDALSRIYPYQIGSNGNLQEWYHDWEDNDPQHRHQSHLFGLYPGNHITPEETPELAEACKRTLEIKGDESTGWSKGWRINLWARLKDGNHAYKMYRTLLRYVDPTGTETNYMQGGGTYPNLLDAHPPFQIDGNFGGSAGVIEMLLQSSEKEILLLPALPDAWENGHIKGIKARGGFEIDVEWENYMLGKCRITSQKGGSTRVRYQDNEKELKLSAGESIVLEF